MKARNKSSRIVNRASRRTFLKKSSAATAALAAFGFPHIRNAEAATTTTWKIQTTWPGGIGLETFRNWCNSIVEKTGGELAFQAFDATDRFNDLQLYEAVRHGALDAINPFSLYWAKRLPLAVFLSSYPLGMRNPHEWDVFYYSLGGLELAREAFAGIGLHYVGPIHRGANILHSKKPISSIEDFRSTNMRLPGGMVAEIFRDAGAKTTILPGSEIFPAATKGKIDVADYAGPATNYSLGFERVFKYISLGPPGFLSIYQPVDLMDLTVGMASWDKLSVAMQRFVETEVHAYSDLHHTAIQKADQEAWKQYKSSGTEITRLSYNDVEAFTRLAVPRWFAWAKRDEFSQKAFQIQLDYMMSGSLGYVTPDMTTGLSL